MECPDCKDCQLEKILSKQGLEVDYCRNCLGVWLDRGEVYLLAIRPEIASKRLTESEKVLKNKISPKTNTAMTPINYPEGIEIYICDSGGIWIDGKQINTFKCSEDNTMLDLAFIGAHDDKHPELSKGVACSSSIVGCETSGRIPKQWIKKVSILVFLSISILWICLFSLNPNL